MISLGSFAAALPLSLLILAGAPPEEVQKLNPAIPIIDSGVCGEGPERTDLHIDLACMVGYR